MGVENGEAIERLRSAAQQYHTGDTRAILGIHTSPTTDSLEGPLGSLVRLVETEVLWLHNGAKYEIQALDLAGQVLETIHGNSENKVKIASGLRCLRGEHESLRALTYSFILRAGRKKRNIPEATTYPVTRKQFRWHEPVPPAIK